MRKLLLGSLGAVALIAGGAARAADMPAAPIVKAPPPPAIDWGGFYFGGHAGYAGSDVRFTFTDDVPNAEDLRFSPSSFIGGIQFGAQWQFDQWIMGVEGTWSGLDTRSRSTRLRLPPSGSAPPGSRCCSTPRRDMRPPD
jgi:outer membrane immunogenic protein